MTITINGRPVDVEATFGKKRPRLMFKEVAMLARKRNTNLLQITVRRPGEAPEPFLFGQALILVDGMEVTVNGLDARPGERY